MNYVIKVDATQGDGGYRIFHMVVYRIEPIEGHMRLKTLGEHTYTHLTTYQALAEFLEARGYLVVEGYDLEQGNDASDVFRRMLREGKATVDEV